MKAIISGGGTGGHIFPALSIADSLRRIDPLCEILFVGASGRMEMEKVPAAGYKIIGLPVAGLQRKLALSNLTLPFKVIGSVAKARRIIRQFDPDVVVGVGGYASAPVLWSASRMGIPCLIQEQNSYAGLTNRVLGKRVAKICVAYPDMERFFPADKIIMTGNPIRNNIWVMSDELKKEGYEFFGLDSKKKTVLVIGGSLGCRTLNEAMEKWIVEKSETADYQVLWQSGKYYEAQVKAIMAEHQPKNVKNVAFIKRMDLAFNIADLVVSRAGAGTISELCACQKATLFVPSPVVAEDHQTHNAMALVNRNAAAIIPDSEATHSLIPAIDNLLSDDARRKEFEKNINALARKDAAEVIAEEIIKLSKEK